MNSNESYCPETLNSGQNRRFFLPCELGIWKTIGHIFYATLSFVHHFKAIGEFKLELLPGNPQFGSKSAIFCPVRPWNLTLKNIRAPLLCYCKVWASFRSHWWNRTGVTVQKRPIWDKIDDSFNRVTLKFDGWPYKTIGHLNMKLYASFHHHMWIKMSYSPETARLGYDLCDLDLLHGHHFCHWQ